MHLVKSLPEPFVQQRYALLKRLARTVYICTVYDRTLFIYGSGEFPAKVTVYTPYIYAPYMTVHCIYMVLINSALACFSELSCQRASK